MEQNCKLSVSSIWVKFKILKYFSLSFQTLIGDHLWSKFQQNWTIFWGERAQKTQERVSWMLNQSKKVWKILISPPPNAILMKLITNIYLKVFHLAKSWSVTHKVQEDINKKLTKWTRKIFGAILTISWYFNKNRSLSDASYCMSSLVKKPPKSSLKWQFLLVRKHLKI